MHDVEHKNTDVPSEQGSQQLHRVLKLREAVALGVGGTIGGGIFVLVGAAAGRAGPGALLAFVLAFAVSLLIALPYAELACRYPLAGGGYAFARALLGERWGFLMGWGYWGAYIFISGYVTLGFAGVAAATLLAFLAFGGFDMVAAAGEEISSPERNLPRAILLTLFLVLGLYLLVTFVALGTLPWNELGSSSAPLSEAATRFLGTTGRQLAAAAALLTTAATGNAVLVVTSGVAFAMARDRLLPGVVARVHPKTGTPWGAVLLNGILLALVALTGSVALAAAVGGFLYVLHFLFTLIALVMLRRRGGSLPAFRTPAPRVVLPLAFGGCLLLLVTSGWTGVSGGLGWLCVGLLAYGVVYIYRRPWQRGQQEGR